MPVTAVNEAGREPAMHPPAGPDVGWGDYESGGCWDEMLDRGRARVACDGVLTYLTGLGGDLQERQRVAESAIRAMGITFTVASKGSDIDRAWPFDVIPRVISTEEWKGIAAGLVQRLFALNLFIADIY